METNLADLSLMEYGLLLVINLHRNITCVTGKRHKIQQVGGAVALRVADAGGCCQVFEWFVVQESIAVGHHFDWMLSLPTSAFLEPPTGSATAAFFAFSFLCVLVILLFLL